MTNMNEMLKNKNALSSRCETRLDAKINQPQHASVTPSSRRSENGIVLLVVLILAAVSLALITALLYLITVGTQASGVQKRYRTALEAAIAGSDITKQIIEVRGDPTAFVNGLTGLNVVQNISPACSGMSYVTGAPMNVTGAAAKIMTSSSTWNNYCGTPIVTANPGPPPDYDFKFQVGTSPRFTVYAKIIDAREGNTSGGGSGGSAGSTNNHILKSTPVVGNGGGGEIPTPQNPYLYAIEVKAQNDAKPDERAELSVLYQY